MTICQHLLIVNFRCYLLDPEPIWFFKTKESFLCLYWIAPSHLHHPSANMTYRSPVWLCAAALRCVPDPSLCPVVSRGVGWGTCTGAEWVNTPWKAKNNCSRALLSALEHSYLKLPFGVKMEKLSVFRKEQRWGETLFLNFILLHFSQARKSSLKNHLRTSLWLTWPLLPRQGFPQTVLMATLASREFCKSLKDLFSILLSEV